MPLPSWLQSRLPPAAPSPYTFESFADEVSRLLGLPPTLRTGEFECGSETDHVWLMWKSDRGGAILVLNRPYGELRESVVIKVWWHHSPDPADVAAMVRAYAPWACQVPSVPAGQGAAPRLSPSPAQVSGRRVRRSHPAAGLPAAESNRRTPNGRNSA